MVLALAVVVGILMVLGLRARRPVPTVPDLPGTSANGAPPAGSDEGGARP